MVALDVACALAVPGAARAARSLPLPRLGTVDGGAEAGAARE